MNAATFFSREVFDHLKADILAQKPFNSEAGYGKKIRVKGNTYALSVHAWRNQSGEYHHSLWYDYNYPGVYGSRNIGGGVGGILDLSSYEAFCEKLNDHLRRYPDYTEPEYVPEQLSLF